MLSMFIPPRLHIFFNLAIGPLDIRANRKREEFRQDYRNLRKALCVGYASQLAERKMHHNGYRTLGFQGQVVQVIIIKESSVTIKI